MTSIIVFQLKWTGHPIKQTNLLTMFGKYYMNNIYSKLEYIYFKNQNWLVDILLCYIFTCKIQIWKDI